MEPKVTGCKKEKCYCPPASSPGKKARKEWPLGVGMLIALLPKCPFCVLAYSSAITMCSGSTYYDHQTGWFSYLSIFLVLVVLASLLFNFHGPRTLIALFAAIAGGILVVFSELVSGDLAFYYQGSFLVLAGALLNGGIYVVVKRLVNKISAVFKAVLN